jgi:AraC-like DNA-binding protein
MTTARGDYFKYLPTQPDFGGWGVGVSAAGFTRVPPGSPYPPSHHPADHHFKWARGRVLGALQIVLIGAGRGWLETRALGRCAIEPGTAFILVPGMWHRYRPVPATGWEESWIELQGPLVNELRARGSISPEAIIRRGALAAGLDDALEAVHAAVRRAGPEFDPELAAHATRVLALWVKSRAVMPVAPKAALAIARAERQLHAGLAEPMSMAKLAREVGLAHSHFRRTFKAHTGFAPWQYVIHQRLARARRLLASTDATLADIGAQLGFSSAFHLSRAFRQEFGVSPDQWRKKLTQSGGGAAPARSRLQ